MFLLTFNLILSREEGAGQNNSKFRMGKVALRNYWVAIILERILYTVLIAS